ncbi:MAG: DsbA family protein [Boseongicola sp.]|nr:DsbA family protein [Boseongicola sp.]MDD9979700.1 DsbA family protein [Boseongicola sp.]
MTRKIMSWGQLIVLSTVLAFAASLAAVAQDASDIDTSDIAEMQIGNADAAVTVVEYASFTCPHCASFHAQAFKDLKADYIDTGKINFVYREVYFDRFGLWAAIVARCGEGAENRFFGIADMLYEQQSDWARQSDPNEIVDRLRTIGKTAGLTDAQLDQCFSDGDTAQKMYARYLQQAEEDGINSTPSFVINGTKYTNMPYDEMKDIIDAAMGG